MTFNKPTKKAIKGKTHPLIALCKHKLRSSFDIFIIITFTSNVNDFNFQSSTGAGRKSLIPTAGIGLMETIQETTEESFDNVMRVNVKMPFFSMSAPGLNVSDETTIDRIIKIGREADLPSQRSRASGIITPHQLIMIIIIKEEALCHLLHRPCIPLIFFTYRLV